MMLDDWNELIANIKAGDTATANVEKWDPSTWPKEAKGVGTVAAPRGVLGHWIKIKDGRIENYQCVVPTTWNGCPRDHKGQIGAFEASLMNTPMANPEQPVEILRTLHCFDPCLACSTHVMSEDGARAHPRQGALKKQHGDTHDEHSIDSSVLPRASRRSSPAAPRWPILATA